MTWGGQEYVKTIINRIDIVRHDLDNLGKLGSDDFKTIEIIFADLDADADLQNHRGLGYVRAFMGSKPKNYYLLQVSTRANPFSLLTFFGGLPIWPVPLEPPQILANQAAFESFLDKFCFRLPYNPPSSEGGTSGGGGQPPSGGPPPPRRSGTGEASDHADYLDAVMKIKADVTDAAIKKNLTHDQSLSLARLAVQQELGLKSIERAIRADPYQRIILNSIRKPVFEIAAQPFQQPKYENIEFIQFRPKRPLWDVSYGQRRVLRRLGVKNESYAVVNEYTYHTQDLMNEWRLGQCDSVLSPNSHFQTMT